jgi:hypothetical protein
VGPLTARAAADLPPHEGLRVVIVSDEVNPHGLPPGQLTQPGDISAALLAPGTGLVLDAAPDAVVEIPTNGIEAATELLAIPRTDPAAYDVLIYFAHRIPNAGADPAGRQAAFTAAVEQFLREGGGLVSFHHGAYFTTGKEGMQDLIGGTASGAVVWNAVAGQNVIDVAPAHFVSCYGADPTGTVAYADPARGVPAGTYPFFNNTPDERYLTFELNPSAGEIEVLFASDYAQSGATHLLGFTHRRAEWNGAVVAYQPGEYQPNALDPDGRNFQVLANAILWSAHRVPRDGVLLGVARGPAAGEVALAWHGCAPSHTVYRSTDPSEVVTPANALGSTAAAAWIDSPPPGDIFYYQVRP